MAVSEKRYGCWNDDRVVELTVIKVVQFDRGWPVDLRWSKHRSDTWWDCVAIDDREVAARYLPESVLYKTRAEAAAALALKVLRDDGCENSA